MKHWCAIRELRKVYTREGVWVWLKHYGLKRFVMHPSDVRDRAAQLNDGAFV